MVAKCINPSCREYSYQYLRGGKLFFRDLRFSRPALQQVGTAAKQSAALEYFWLCEKCSPGLTVILDRYGRPGVVESLPASPDEAAESILPPEAA